MIRSFSSQDIVTWGSAARQAAALGEGDPARWAAAGLRPVSPALAGRLAVASELAVAMAGPVMPRSITRVIGGACIYKSDGIFARLPISFLWEVLTIALFARALHAQGLILLPIAEEIYRAPQLQSAYKQLGEELTASVAHLSKVTGVPLQAYWNPHGLSPGDFAGEDLYGLFQPFADAPQMTSYPFGHPDEESILRVYASYCARYRFPPGGLQPGDVLVEGIHISKSVLLGAGTDTTYIATLPLPSFTEQQRLMVDTWPVPTIAEPLGALPPAWVDDVLLRGLSYELEALRRALVDEGLSPR